MPTSKTMKVSSQRGFKPGWSYRVFKGQCLQLLALQDVMRSRWATSSWLPKWRSRIHRKDLCFIVCWNSKYKEKFYRDLERNPLWKVFGKKARVPLPGANSEQLWAGLLSRGWRGSRAIILSMWGRYMCWVKIWQENDQFAWQAPELFLVRRVMLTVPG